MFDKVGFYRTRDGRIAKVLTIIDARLPRLYPVLGILDGEEEKWSTAGAANYSGRALDSDLVEYLGPTKPKQKRMVTKTVEVYMNVYQNPLNNCVYESESEANVGTDGGRIACVKLTGTYEVEEEVYE